MNHPREDSSSDGSTSEPEGAGTADAEPDGSEESPALRRAKKLAGDANQQKVLTVEEVRKLFCHYLPMERSKWFRDYRDDLTFQKIGRRKVMTVEQAVDALEKAVKEHPLEIGQSDQ